MTSRTIRFCELAASLYVNAAAIQYEGRQIDRPSHQYSDDQEAQHYSLESDFQIYVPQGPPYAEAVTDKPA